jgi:hypothetical protein
MILRVTRIRDRDTAVEVCGADVSVGEQAAEEAVDEAGDGGTSSTPQGFLAGCAAEGTRRPVRKRKTADL